MSDDLRNNDELKITRRNLPHWELDGAVYFVTFKTFQKLELTPIARTIVLNCCLFFDESHPNNIPRYHTFSLVIMPDHVHWLLQPLPKINTEIEEEQTKAEYWSLTRILHSIKSYTAKQISKIMKHRGIIWQDERYDRIIRNHQEFINTWQYIRQNPVQEKLSDMAEDYPFLWEEF
ncbi:transposase [Planktothrix mougeotii]|uniref:Transposase n=1 Tax=Planktothrix mougeotii LEGE 06226 TaxID=1828728 RepID=A0ABR9UC03_9CYAN|nr:transposase [Planktothrix mougeotii]MBE9144002.1 transposase [Planktothrix mougeotii LEGE 06226]